MSLPQRAAVGGEGRRSVTATATHCTVIFRRPQRCLTVQQVSYRAADASVVRAGARASGVLSCFGG